MLAVKKITGSFRDPSGHVFQVDSRIFRTVNLCFASDFVYVRSSGILEKLTNAGLLLPVTVVPDPAPNQGWRERERSGFQARASANGVLALASIHPLAISRNIPFDELLEWIVGLVTHGIIEFVPKNDPMVQKLLRKREDIFSIYSEAVFLKIISQKAKVVHSHASQKVDGCS